MTSRRHRPHRLARLPLMLCIVLAALLSACAGPGSTSSNALPSTTTGTSEITGVTSTVRTLTVDGMQRSYLVVAPATQHGPLPLLMVLHGRAVTAQQEEARTGFVPLAEQGTAVLVYPEGYQESWNAGGCCGGAQTANVNDTAFIAAVVGAMRHEYSINNNRIYLVGYSNGARMAYTEVCAHPTLFTAFATYAGVPTESCDTDTDIPVPVLISAGTDDPELPTTDPPQTTTQVIDSLTQEWLNRDGCNEATTSQSVPPAQVTRWPYCEEGATVETVLYDGLTHFWPTASNAGTPFSTVVGPQAAGATLMWNFLKTHVASSADSASS